MERNKRDRSSDSSGQVLVIVALAMVTLIAMVGVIIDGGHAWGKQRETQNGADATAKAGARVIQELLTGATVDDGDVGCAVEDAADANEVTLVSAVYTDFQGDEIAGSPVGSCTSTNPIPASAQGVKAIGSQQFDTFLAQVVGITEFTAQANATAVVGAIEGICAADAGCAVLPVTFPRTFDTCDGSNKRTIGEDEWPILDPEVTTLDANNLSIMPLCVTGPGSVGWLDFGCGNLRSHINDPCNAYIPIPAWLDTSTGNSNCCENDLEQFTGTAPGVPEDDDMVVYIPVHDFTCGDSDLADDDPITDCSTYVNPTSVWSGNGSGMHYHVPYWAGFKFDGAFTQGNDAECNQAPGSPPAGGNGATGCLKGWWVELVETPGAIGVGDINPGDPVATGILLIE